MTADQVTRVGQQGRQSRILATPAADDAIGKIAFWFIVLGFNRAFVPMHFTGMVGDIVRSLARHSSPAYAAYWPPRSSALALPKSLLSSNRSAAPCSKVSKRTLADALKCGRSCTRTHARVITPTLVR